MVAEQKRSRMIALTGGGSSGHITPNLAVAEVLAPRGWSVHYIGGHNSLEQQLATEWGAPFYGISTGKFRREFTWKNVVDAVKAFKGIVDSFLVLRKLKPDVVFSKGGFVGFPVAFGAWLNRIPVVIHESDRTLGLANRLSLPFTNMVCVSFPETTGGTRATRFTGNPIRKAISDALQSTQPQSDLRTSRPILLVFGGSLGARRINETVRALLETLLSEFEVVHICGKGNLDPGIQHDYYRQFEYLSHEFPALLASANVVICRAGANTMFELITAAKPAILIPLPKSGTRGDQILNAEWFVSKGFGLSIRHEELNTDILLKTIREFHQHRVEFAEAMKRYRLPNAAVAIADAIEETAKKPLPD
jgi:UDP-N-acetylglucosamine--N-acetylmuramyl-(pentapeptide) pyrophosphoryl-undecaprenol N-acetylglucosamine transferase